MDGSTVSVSGVKMPAARALKQPDIRLADLVGAGQIRAGSGSASTRRWTSPASKRTSSTEGICGGSWRPWSGSAGRKAAPIPSDFEFLGIPGLSREMIQRLSEARPATLGQAARLPGVTPAAVAVLATYIDRPKPTTV